MASAAVSAVAIWFFAAHGWLYYFGDAEAHLNHARGIVDTMSPGWEQLGSPWLPLPHLLIAPFAANDSLWHNGLAGSIPSGLCFCFAAFFTFIAAEELFASAGAAWCSLLVLILNPNALYLQSSAMTEPFFALAICGILCFSVRFRRTQSIRDVVWTAVFALAGDLTRYDGWFLVPFCALYFLLVGRRRWLAGLVFTAIACSGPALWLFYNWWLSGNWLEFYNGPSSAKAIQGAAAYPGLHDWRLSWIYVTNCIRLVLARPLLWMTAVGSIAMLVRSRRAWWPVTLLVLPPVFYIWSMHSSGNPIFMPNLYPHSWYNTRYGLSALPLAAISAGALTCQIPGRFRIVLSCILVLLAVAPWLADPHPDAWITWKESERNSISRREWTYLAANYLREKIRPGEHVAAELNDTIGIFRCAGIPLKQVFHQADGLQWQAAVNRPDLFLNTTWIVCQRNTNGELSRAAQNSDNHVLIKTIQAAGAAPLDIYRHANPFHQSSRSEK